MAVKVFKIFYKNFYNLSISTPIAFNDLFLKRVCRTCRFKTALTFWIFLFATCSWLLSFFSFFLAWIIGWRYKSVLNVTRVAVVAWLTGQGNWFCLVWAVAAAKSLDIWTFIDNDHSTATAITDMTGGMLPTASNRKPFVPLPSTAGHRRTCPRSCLKASQGQKHLPRTSIRRPWYKEGCQVRGGGAVLDPVAVRGI